MRCTRAHVAATNAAENWTSRKKTAKIAASTALLSPGTTERTEPPTTESKRTDQDPTTRPFGTAVAAAVQPAARAAEQPAARAATQPAARAENSEIVAAWRALPYDLDSFQLLVAKSLELARGVRRAAQRCVRESLSSPM